jgi:hypothetical protein
MQAAWTMAALGRAKKMTPLKDLLSTPEVKPKAKKTSWQTMYAAAAGWTAAVGEIRTEGTAS